ncbi:MAG TPA: phosphopantetheinyl transferase [Hyphomicrobium sp.]|nr:phosphopantetheinyl transferase [Hyphomicrobium sp.]
MPAAAKSSADAGGGSKGSQAAPEIELFFVDLLRGMPALDAEEARTPRLSDADRARADAMAEVEAKRLWRASRIATRIVLERLGGAALRRIAFEVEPGGRPILRGGPHFSISHTGGAALIAVSNSTPVGVDLEQESRALKMSAERRSRVVRAAADLGTLTPLSAEQDRDVLAAWVQLEAAAKALGIGIGRLLTEAGVVGGREAVAATGSQRRLTVRALAIETGYLAGIAAERLPDVLSVEAFPHERLDTFLRGQ